MTHETDPLVRQEYKKVFARGVAEIIFTNAVEALSWGDYPEIGEYDWEDIVNMVSECGPRSVSMVELERAYDALTARV